MMNFGIGSSFHPSRILVFGSRARGDAREDSDLDLIVVSEAFTDIKFPDRPGHVLRAIRFPHPVDCFCYTPQEFARLLDSSCAIHDALREGLDAA